MFLSSGLAHRQPLVVLVDDLRSFRDGRECLVARTVEETMRLLDTIGDAHIAELWLDYDLGGGTTVEPVIDRLVAEATQGSPLDVGRVIVHSANTRGGFEIKRRLAVAGYSVERDFNQMRWVRDGMRRAVPS
jgi:hypothetical protein